MLQTLIYFGIIAVGAGLGAAFRSREKFLKSVDVLTLCAVAALVFLLGIGVGHSEEVRRHIASLGVTAVALGVAAAAGGGLASWVVQAVWFRKLDHEE